MDLKKLLSSSSIVFVGTLVSSFFAYLFNMIMGRLLGPTQYGEMMAILSLLMILSVGGGAILTVATRYSSEIYALGEREALKKLIAVLTRYLTYLALVFFLAGLLLARPVANFLAIEEKTPVMLAAFSFLFGFIIMVNKGVLQGTQRFVPLSLVSIFEMLVRLLLGVALVKFGLALGGAIGAIVLASALAYLLTLWPIARVLNSIKASASRSFKFNRQEIAAYSGPALAAAILLAISLNVDVILVKHYFSGTEAGQYAAVSTVAKIILYATSPVISVMFPMILEHRTKGDKHYKIFLYSLFFTLIGSLIILALYQLIPAVIIKLLYGQGFVNLNYLLPRIGLAILFYSLINFMVNYYLAVHNFVFIWFFSLAIIFQICAVYLWHGSIETVVGILIGSLGLLFALMLGYYLYTKRGQLALYLKGVP